jgi:hypothetical protein
MNIDLTDEQVSIHTRALKEDPMYTAIIPIIIAAAVFVALVLSGTVFTGGEDGRPIRHFDYHPRQFDRAEKVEREIPTLAEIPLRVCW